DHRPSRTWATSLAPKRRKEMDRRHHQRFGTAMGLSEDESPRRDGLIVARTRQPPCLFPPSRRALSHAPRLVAAQSLRELRQVHCNAPSFVARQQFRRRAPSQLVLEIDIGKLLSVMVAHDIASVRRTTAVGSGDCPSRLGIGRFTVTNVTGGRWKSHRSTSKVNAYCLRTLRLITASLYQMT